MVDEILTPITKKLKKKYRKPRCARKLYPIANEIPIESSITDNEEGCPSNHVDKNITDVADVLNIDPSVPDRITAPITEELEYPTQSTSGKKRGNVGQKPKQETSSIGKGVQGPKTTAAPWQRNEARL